MLRSLLGKAVRGWSAAVESVVAERNAVGV